ncbi:hypothetical protein PV327_002770 [Microctonus hyperodae]|uniref:Uncharacterized protein n=1 Tax=Microctonus hyperodae TaxID=165561 RepID=A0AA39FGL7_MICHY|nr:hypothetical protein PV327_002770 [Microctonus hyperodae]
MITYKNCPICEEDGHATFSCTKLNSLPVPERIDAVKKANLCFNCLRQNHRTNECNKEYREICDLRAILLKDTGFNAKWFGDIYQFNWAMLIPATMAYKLDDGGGRI